MGDEWQISWHPRVKPSELDETIRRVAASTLHFYCNQNYVIISLCVFIYTASIQEVTLAGSCND